MTLPNRIFLAITLLLLDFVMFLIPVLAVFSVYIILARPLWFKQWILALYGD